MTIMTIYTLRHKKKLYNMATTIRISRDLLDELKSRYDKKSCKDIIRYYGALRTDP